MVFNLEVDGEHVYAVAGRGLLVHNNCDDLYGPFYHSATDDVVKKIKESSELWGQAPRNYFGSNFPKAKAWDGPLPDGINGVEFFTSVKPDTWIENGLVLWTGVEFEDWAKIAIEVVE